MIYFVYLQLDGEVSKHIGELNLRITYKDESDYKKREDMKTFIRSCGGSDYELTILMHLHTLDHLKDALDKCSVSELSSVFNCPLYIILQIKNRLDSLDDVAAFRSRAPKKAKNIAAVDRKYK